MAAIDMIVENPEKFNSKKPAFANIIFDDMNPYCKFLVINIFKLQIFAHRFIYFTFLCLGINTCLIIFSANW